MLKAALTIATVLSLGLVAGIAGYSAWDQKRESEQVRTELEEARATAEITSEKVAFLGEQLTNSQQRVEQLQREKAKLLEEKEAVTEQQKKMEGQMRSALEDREVTISELQGKLTVNIVDRVLFDSGAAELKDEGQQVLAQIAEVLAEHPNRQIYVIGHTDNVPIRASVFSRYANNWELSTARATAAVKFLSEQAGVEPSRLAAVGYGEHHPIADNSTAEGRARNRRIAIVIMPEHFNPLESPENSASDTNQVEITTAEEVTGEPEETAEEETPREPKPIELSPELLREPADTNKLEEIDRKLSEIKEGRDEP